MSKWMREVNRGSPVPKDTVLLGLTDLQVKIQPFLEEDTPFPHTLLIGMPGTGKTNFARYIAQVKKLPFLELHAPVSENDIAGIGLTLIDEAHLQRHAEELFPLMEPDDNDVRTIIAATSRPEKLDDAWRSRFTLRLKLGDYEKEDMYEIAQHMLHGASEEALRVYASASGGNPRHLRRIATVANTIGIEEIDHVLATVETTIDGLTQIHLDYLRCLSKVGRAVGLTQLSALTYSGENELRAAERLLMKLELIDLTNSGRAITRSGASFIRSFDS